MIESELQEITAMMREHPELDTAENRQTLQHFQQLAGGGNDDDQLHVIEMKIGPNGQLQDTETKGILVQQGDNSLLLSGEDDTKQAVSWHSFVDISANKVDYPLPVPGKTLDVRDKAEQRPNHYFVVYNPASGVRTVAYKFRAIFTDKTDIDGIPIVNTDDDVTRILDENPAAVVIHQVSEETYKAVPQNHSSRKKYHEILKKQQTEIIADKQQLVAIPLMLRTQEGLIGFDDDELKPIIVNSNEQKEQPITDEDKIRMLKLFIDIYPLYVNPDNEDFIQSTFGQMDDDTYKSMKQAVYGYENKDSS